MAQEVALERLVISVEAPLHTRFYAWTKLLRHWSSLRWDDTNGVNPGKLHRRAQGLAYTLERSKTSGPDKKTKLLPVFVPSDA